MGLFVIPNVGRRY